MSDLLVLDLNKDDTVFELDLSKEFPKVRKLRVVLNWDPHPVYGSTKGKGFDPDLWVFMLREGERLNNAREDLGRVAYFNNKKIRDVISVPKDNQTGEDDGTGEDEVAHIDLNKLNEDEPILALYTILSKLKPEQKDHHFGMIANARVVVKNDETDEEICQFNLSADHSGKTAVHLFNVTRDGVITTHGKGGAMNGNDILGFYMKK